MLLINNPRLRLVNLTENYEKHTFQAPCSCLKSGLTIDGVVIKYLISFGRKLYSMENTLMSVLSLVCFIIVSRENELLCFLIFYEVWNENFKFCIKRYMVLPEQ